MTITVEELLTQSLRFNRCKSKTKVLVVTSLTNYNHYLFSFSETLSNHQRKQTTMFQQIVTADCKLNKVALLSMLETCINLKYKSLFTIKVRGYVLEIMFELEQYKSDIHYYYPEKVVTKDISFKIDKDVLPSLYTKVLNREINTQDEFMVAVRDYQV